MQKYRVETIYENNMKDFVLLHGQTIHGLGPEDIVQRVMLQAWEKKEKLEYHENLIGWFVVACSKECKALYRRAYTEHRNVGHGSIPHTRCAPAGSGGFAARQETRLLPSG